MQDHQQIQQFQSTFPVWGTTWEMDTVHGNKKDFNPRSPCGERPSRTALKPSPLFISIHVPRVGNDHKWYISGIFAIIISIHVPRVGNDNNHKTEQPNLNKFQSTFPVWGTTGSCCRQSSRSNHFNPRSPCGERLLSC